VFRVTGRETLHQKRFHLGYSSSTDDLFNDFYLPCLERSTRYDRSAGFFSSAIFSLAPLAFADFVDRRGRMRLICSPRMTEVDLKALSISEESDQEPVDAFRREVETSISDRQRLDLVNFTAALVRSGALDIRVCVPVSGSATAMYHDKVGLFSDDSDTVLFLGSANETAMAWSPWGNHEDIEVLTSWTPGESDRIARHKRNFERLWNGGYRTWRTLAPSETDLMLLDASEEIPLEECMERVRQAKEKYKPSVFEGSDEISISNTLMEHQRAVLESWRSREFRGIVTFATGGGKTLVGLTAIEEHVTHGGPALVLLPTVDLQQQWLNEIKNKFPHLSSRVMLVGGGENWRRHMDSLRTIFAQPQQSDGWIILSTYQSATLDDFSTLAALAPDLLVVADEAHNAGRRTFWAFMDSVDAFKRLGLSATPERFGDLEGTTKILEYFGEPLEPSYSIRDGINSGQLTPYSYAFSTVRLTSLEQEDWDALTQRLGVVEARIRSGEGGLLELKNRLLQERSRIAKKAEGKVDAAVSSLIKNLKDGQRWLVYCQDRDQLSQVKRALQAEFPRYPILEFHSGLTREQRRSTLEYFASVPSIICAINCLDEGIDVPSADAALILASSTNPRQYIQRRGRILRASRSGFKPLATLKDFLVLSEDGILLTVSEATRAMEFAADSSNFLATAQIESLLAAAGVSGDLDDAFEETEQGGDDE